MLLNTRKSTILNLLLELFTDPPVQEHMEELCSLKCTCMDKEWEGEAASLHRQLQAKDMELRHIQRNMDQWKEQTATRLASTFEEALIDELER